MTLNEGFFGSKRNNKHCLNWDVFMNILVHASNASTIRKYFKQMLQKEPTQCTFPSQSQPDLSIKAFKVSILPNDVIISD